MGESGAEKCLDTYLSEMQKQNKKSHEKNQSWYSFYVLLIKSFFSGLWKDQTGFLEEI